MRSTLSIRSVVAALALAFAASAGAQDTLKLAAGQRGNWDTSISEMCMRSGICKKHGIAVEILWTQGAGETQQAVIAGSADLGIAGGIMGALSAFSKGAPVRIISAETTGAADLWNAITTPERIARWLAPISGDFRLGGTYQIEGNANGTITACEPPSHLGATWEFGAT